MRLLREIYLIPVYLYKGLLSPFFSGHVCLYNPTCSTYMVEAVLRYGIIKGTYMGLARLLRCNRHFMGGDDPVPDSWSKEVIKERYVLFRRH